MANCVYLGACTIGNIRQKGFGMAKKKKKKKRRDGPLPGCSTGFLGCEKISMMPNSDDATETTGATNLLLPLLLLAGPDDGHAGCM